MMEAEDRAELLPDGEIEMRLFKRRWIMVLLYFMLVLVPGMFSNTFAPVQNVVIAAFDVTPLEVNIFSLVSFALTVPISLVSGYVFEHKGLWFGIMLAAVPLLVSGWIRYLGSMYNYFWVIVFGQTVVAIGTPFGLAAATLLSESWCAVSERTLVTAIGSLAFTIGSVVASIFTPMIIRQTAASTVETMRHDITQCLFYEAIAATVVGGLVIIFFRGSPPLPPSYTAAQHLSHAKEEHDVTLLQIFKMVFSNRNFMVLMVAFGLGYGVINALATLLNQIIIPLGYSTDDAGNIGAALGAGLVSSIILGIVADITKKLYLITVVCSTFMIGSWGWLMFQLWYDMGNVQPWLLGGAVASLGFFGVPIAPLILEMGAETLYPLSEAVAAGFLWLAGNLCALVQVIACTAMQQGVPPDYPKASMRNATYFLTACIALCGICVLLFRPEFKRQAVEAADHGAHVHVNSNGSNKVLKSHV